MQPKLLNFYLDATKRRLAETGEGIFGGIVAAVRAAGWQTTYRGQTEEVSGPGYHLLYNRPVDDPFCLSLRRCYLENYYRIEATNDRWDWDVADLRFPAQKGPGWFQTYWRDRLFMGETMGQGGYIFMPLQGKLLQRRHFQAQSPVDMIHATLMADPGRQIIATLHPREVYSDAERAALQGIDRFTLASSKSMPLLAGCDYVVTENSALALTGYFAAKPAVLFARIDFHHIAGLVPKQGVAAAFAKARQPQPFADYLWWFFKKNAICAVGDGSAAQIEKRLRDHGWPL